jgi:hypothetical protein
MGFAPSVASLGAERLANHGMELRTPLITAPAGRYQGAPALIPAVSRQNRGRALGCTSNATPCSFVRWRWVAANED